MMNAVAENSKFVSEPGPPTPVKLSHVSIRSSENWERMVEFYVTLLNMRVVYTIRGRILFCMLSFDDENHRVGIAKVPNIGRAEPRRTCLEHSSWNYGSMKELFAAVKRFHAKTGEWPDHTVHQGPIIAVSYFDPDGNRVELTADNYGSQAEIVQYFHDRYEDPSFNTLLRFDITRMIALYEEGMPLEELTRYEKVQELLAENRL
jgi:catechol 2,3-dioxygenase-like lactoylglutathione lyase family enzyme